MKKTLLAILAAAFPAAAQLPAGLGDLLWGEPPSRDMMLVGRSAPGAERPTRFYMKKRDEIALASIRFGTIEYAFREKKGLVAAFCTVGRTGSAPAGNGTLAELDALFGPHENGPGGAPSWRGARTLAVLVPPRDLGGSAPLLAFFAAPVADEDVASDLREWNLRSAGGSR